MNLRESIALGVTVRSRRITAFEFLTPLGEYRCLPPPAKRRTINSRFSLKERGKLIVTRTGGLGNWESWQSLGLPRFLTPPEHRTDPKFANFSVLQARPWTNIAIESRCFRRTDRRNHSRRGACDGQEFRRIRVRSMDGRAFFASAVQNCGNACSP